MHFSAVDISNYVYHNAHIKGREDKNRLYSNIISSYINMNKLLITIAFLAVGPPSYRPL